MKKYLALALTLALALGLTACGSSAPAEPAAADASPDSTKAGTSLKGFSSIESGAEFIGTWEYDDYNGGYIIYADGSADIVWQSSGTETGSWEANGDSITVNNSDGDWYADLSFTEDGGLIDDEDDTLFYTEVFSFDTSGSADFVGKWEYDDYNIGITILGSGTCYITTPDGSFTGTWEMKGDSIMTYIDGEEAYELSYNADGGLIDDEGDTLFYTDFFSFEDSEASDFTGTWEYDEYYGGYVIYADGAADIVWKSSGTETGSWEANGDSITVYNEDGDWYADLSFTDGGKLIDDEDDTLYRTGGEFSF